jgi:hypothetical protein
VKVLEYLKHQSSTQLVRFACYLALLGLAIMAHSIVNPGAIPVIFAMSAGHLVGALAFLAYVSAIIFDVARGNARQKDVTPSRSSQQSDDSASPRGE